MNSTPCKIQFKAKIEEPRYTDGTSAGKRLRVPELGRRHCDMNAFRVSAKFGSYANSDLFPALLARALKAAGIGDRLDLEKPLPECVKIDASGFLAVVTITL